MNREEMKAYASRVIDLGLNDETQDFCKSVISALSAEGEYIKKEDTKNCFIKWRPYMATRMYEYEKEMLELPTVSFPDREKGEWKKIWRDDCECSEYVCSKCDCGEDYVTDFCPNCGADMRGET